MTRTNLWFSEELLARLKLAKAKTSIRYWLRKFNLKTKKVSYFRHTGCVLCGKDNLDKYLCGGCLTKVRRYRQKKRAVELLGGVCTNCGWKGNIAGFDFHHTDPSEKEFNIGKVANKSWAVLSIELKKCVLLCGTCHRIEHSSNTDPKFREVAENYYRGKLPSF